MFSSVSKLINYISFKQVPTIPCISNGYVNAINGKSINIKYLKKGDEIIE